MASEPLLSVVMPTYNRRAILPEALNALEAQTLSRERFELVIVDDGSTDDTPAFLSRYLKESPLHVRCDAQENKGPGAARNRGVRQAHGWLILFLGDDIMVAPDLLDQHLAWHRERLEDSVAVLGRITWDPGRPITPFMWWLENGGPQYKYWAIQDPENAGYRHFYASNISFKRQFLLQKGLFDEEFPYASTEDTELGLRLERQGMRMTYNAQAVGHHDHYTTLAGAVRRMVRVGESELIFRRKTGQEIPIRPSRPPWIEGAAQAKFHLLWWLGERVEQRWVWPRLYAYLMDKALWEGLYGGAKGL